MLTRAETRGKDSVGVAYRLENQLKSYRLDVSATEFVQDKAAVAVLSDARRSLRGIAHTRRASPNMPIDSANAHPFPFWKYFFAHNGKVQNWKEIKAVLIAHYESEVTRLNGSAEVEAAKTAKYCLDYCKSITTDSMVLGPYIEARDMTSIIGCMGLVWMRGSNVYAFRYAKEAVASTIAWRYTKADIDEDPEDHIVTVVASIPLIIEAFEKVPDIEFDMSEIKSIQEGHVFRVEPLGLVDEGVIPTNSPVEDEFSSQAVESPAEMTAHEKVVTA